MRAITGGADSEKRRQMSSADSASSQSVPSSNSSSKSSPSMSSTWSSRPHSKTSRPSIGSSVKRLYSSPSFGFGFHAVKPRRAPWHETRASSAATFAWSGAKIRPKFDTRTSKHPSSYGRYSTLPRSKPISTPSCSARSRAFASIGSAMSIPVTAAPLRAARTATSPVPVARSRTRSVFVMSSRLTSWSCTGVRRAANRSYVPVLQTSRASLIDVPEHTFGVSDLFSEAAGRRLDATAPLAQRLRPRTLDDFAGQEHVVGRARALRLAIEQDRVPSMILYGPPGSGKTTLARIVAQTTGAEFEELSAVNATVANVREVLRGARERLGASGRRTILFLDEIHRFNKAQQDALLPGVEEGLVTLIGATTENPYMEVNSALLSRAQVYELESLSIEDLETVARRGAAALGVTLPDDIVALVARRAG